ncbi:putative hemolysin [Caulobacter ginsengisoli]|uniref:Hemolysin n=1 Tax=Caulobacter ginsengisoli TaxID=400775 RepID=A0ABU0ITH9_9CAUL|nr:hypothetical protein [Caulobacter ginsengisoli]MDQ0465311.1 putative hemolysin [Caulobacter ginsengisoli]
MRFALLLLLAGCASAAPSPPPADPFAVGGPFSAGPENCQARGGRIEIAKGERRVCRVRLPDAARTCTDGGQCLSKVCVADTPLMAPPDGTCAFSNINTGCFTQLTDGRAREICVN